ncbi:hypothetical protein [Flavobacterium selenitireducens]|uniref:hypothetical protein n=1 Tax=Flavobacterium selenitireducens TaxID=2722704 RepID=UPI00168B052F|nr:hypothetical protein [Flavobacterium selenitireducens]MBD3581557.1 hypothetical protein [Flavobacterium selenitireducens]
MEKIKEEVLKNINSNYNNIKFQLETPYGSSDFDIIREEICKCILFDLNQAAITLTNHFSEFFMKIMLEYQEVRNNKSNELSVATKLKESVEKYDNENLEKNINVACSKGIITKEQKLILKRLKDKYRNPYSHSIKYKIFGDQILKGFTIDNVIGFNLTETKISDSPQLHGLFQMLKSKKEAIEYFKQFDEIVRNVLDNFYSKPENL